MKNAIRTAIRRLGYVVRHVGSAESPAGIDLHSDVQAAVGCMPGMLLFDVGANIGQTIDAFQRAFNSPRIISFEPSPKSFATLQKRYGSLRNVTLEQFAIGAEPGVLPFNVTAGHSVNDSLLKPAFKDDVHSVDVKVDTLDNYCAANRIDAIDFLKIDTQGYDVHVLRGAGRLLTERRIRSLSIELNFSELYVGQPSYIEVLSAVDRLGYRLLGFYEQSYISKSLHYCDACFVAP